MARQSMALLIAVILGGCDDETRRPSADSGTDGIVVFDGSSDTGGGCSPSAFMEDAVEFCRTQNPSAPMPRQMGSSCSDDSQCDTSWCLEPFGSSAYCTFECPTGTECPVGYSCQDTGTARGSACYQSVCIYGGTDASDCINNVNQEIDAACFDGCGSELGAWLSCLRGAGRLCGNSDAADACGIERGLLESCCVGCSSSSW